jgi:hypothetical protein
MFMDRGILLSGSIVRAVSLPAFGALLDSEDNIVDIQQLVLIVGGLHNGDILPIDSIERIDQ